MRQRLALMALLLSFAVSAFAQHEPTSTWPYLYPDFTEGEIRTSDGTAKPGFFNVHILYGRLHFVDGELIKEAAQSGVSSVRIGNDIFVNVSGEMMKVLARDDNACIGEKAEVDMVQLNATGGAYGSSSSTLATTALSSLEAIGNGMSATNHMELKNSKEDGKILPLVRKSYIIVPGKVIYAARKDVMEQSGIDAKEMNSFIKENKIRWKNPESLLKLAGFINERNK